jgi:fatty-acyl-CoA synthase
MFCPQAFGVPDREVGEEICVFLRLREGATLTEQDVRDYSRDKVGGQVRMVWELL